MRSFDYWGNFGTDTIYTHVLFSYQNNRLSQVLYVEKGNSLVDDDSTLSQVFTNAAGNINKMVFLDEYGIPMDSIEYQYDAQPNYFRAAHPHFFLVDPFFMIYAGFESNLALFYSTNNVVKFTIYGNADYNISYDTDALNNISGLKLDGEDYMRYKFSCQ